MVSFDFVTDEELRAWLESDALEMAACLEAKAYKAVVVLAGSIVEALLTDHLASIGYEDPKGTPLVDMDLAHLIAAARSEKVLSPKSADLSSAVKGYRNLIHPGRLIRQKERIDASTAAIAGHLVEVVASEVADLKRDTYGYTAQQIVSKTENDSSSLAILGDLLKTTGEREIERLLVSDLPGRYMELKALEPDDDEYYAPILARLRRAYRAAFDSAGDAVKRRVTKSYARMLREEVSEFRVLTQERALFRAQDLAYMTDEDAAMAKRHLLSRVGREVPQELSEPLIGIGGFADKSELAALVDAYIRSASVLPVRRQAAGELLQRLFGEAPTPVDASITKRIEDWERTYEERNPELVAWLESQRTSMEAKWLEDLPF